MDKTALLQPVVTARAYESIVSQIEKLIAGGQWAVGDQLPSERALSEQFAVSRVVIREAMRHLEARRIIEVRHGAGVFVRNNPTEILAQPVTLMLRLEESSLIDLYVVRQALELVSVPLAAERATDAQIGELVAQAEEMERRLIEHQAHPGEETFRLFTAQDAEFHRAIARASGNEALATLLDAVLPLIVAARYKLLKRSGRIEQSRALSSPDQLRREHAAILAAILAHDPVEAQAQIRIHLDRSIATYRDLQ